jgi:hypothetical protein
MSGRPTRATVERWKEMGLSGEVAEQRAKELGLSFEPADIVNEVMSFGSPTPIEVQIAGSNMAANRAYAKKRFGELSQIAALRDLQYAQPLDYPTVEACLKTNGFSDRRKPVGQSFVGCCSPPGVDKWMGSIDVFLLNQFFNRNS